jgi:hypothetical protein
MASIQVVIKGLPISQKVMVSAVVSCDHSNISISRDRINAIITFREAKRTGLNILDFLRKQVVRTKTGI